MRAKRGAVLRGSKEARRWTGEHARAVVCGGMGVVPSDRWCVCVGAQTTAPVPHLVLSTSLYKC